MPSTERKRPLVAEIEPPAVRRALDSILQSAPFRTSRQCQDMLRYVVEHSLRDEQESLRERVIGIEVFGRNSDYDTSGDPVVRIRAADIRKRLAQYYQSAPAADAPIRIDIPPGSYRAFFKVTEHPAPAPVLVAESHPVIDAQAPPVLVPLPLEAPAIRNRTRTLLIVAAFVVLVALAATWGWRLHAARAPGAFEKFWTPVFASRKPVIIYAGENAVYRLSDQFLDRYRAQHHLENTGPEIVVQLPRGQKISAGDLIPVGDTTADGRACALFVSLITRAQRPFDLRYGTDISLGDLQDSPSILIGAFNNPWTLKTTNSLRFVFRQGNRIEDTWHQLPGWAVVDNPNSGTTDDYALISRLFDPQDGHILITAAGIGSFGTEAAAEFLTNPREMDEIARTAPAGWQKKNLQIVLHVTVRDVQQNENIVATQYW